VGVAAVQLGAAVATEPIDEVGPLGAALLRNLLAVPMLVLVFPPRRGRGMRRSLGLVALLGLSLAAMNSAIYAAIDRVDLGIAVTIEFLGPLGVAVVAARGARALLWVALAAGGVVLLAGPVGESPDAAGMAFAALAGCGWAAYILVGQRVGTALGGASGLTVAVAIAAGLLLVPGTVTSGGDLTGGGILAAAAAVAVLSTAIPYSAEIEALRWIPAGTFGVLMSLEPAVAALVGLATLGQGMAASEVAGIACVVVASAGAVRAAAAPPTVRD
jgi:inner membrane transporter RhtA